MPTSVIEAGSGPGSAWLAVWFGSAFAARSCFGRKVWVRQALVPWSATRLREPPGTIPVRRGWSERWKGTWQGKEVFSWDPSDESSFQDRDLVSVDFHGRRQRQVRRAAADHDVDVAALHHPFARGCCRGIHLEVVEILEADRNRDLLFLASLQMDALESPSAPCGASPRLRVGEGNEDHDDFVSRHAPVLATLTTTGNTAPWLMSEHPSCSLRYSKLV